MAKEIKNEKGTFTFKGNLKEINKIMKDDGITLSRLELVILDKEMESQVKLNVFPNSVAKYWDSNSKAIVEVSSRIEETMREVKANNMGMPFGIDMKTPKGSKTYYIQDELITDLCKLKAGQFNVSVNGSIDFRTYNNRVQKNYNIKSIEILQKAEYGLLVQFPIVISEMNKSRVFYTDALKKLTVLVKAKLENGQYGYRPIELGLDKNYLLGGNVAKALKGREDALKLINESILKPYHTAIHQTQGYTVLVIKGRLKVGEVVKKPTIEDLNPMEKVLLEIQGEEALKEKLDSMDLIKEYFDSVILVEFSFDHSVLKVQEISESELNLENNSTNDLSQSSNPMSDILNGIMSDNKEVEKNSSDIFVNNNEEDISEKNTATSDKLKEFVEEETEDNSETNSDNNSYNSDDFPFN